jgi:superfamily II DNA or RNA helicase/HKD family nuclease
VLATKALGDLVDNKCITPWALGEAINWLVEKSPNPSLSVATAYYNIQALKVLGASLPKLEKLRILVGKEQEQTFVVTQKLYEEIQTCLSQGEENTEELKRWQDFIARGNVEVRVYRKGFLHGKAYLVEGKDVSPAGAVGFVGSSNFTGAGLTTNLELNAVLMQPSAVAQLRDWFETLWKESEDYKRELLDMLSKFTQTYTPYEIYIKVLYEAFRDRLGTDLAEDKGQPSPIALANFQHDGYLAAKDILENYGGVLIADSVGLGKTYLAMRLLDDYAYRERLPTLIICPAALRETLWEPLLRKYGIRADVISMERFSRENFPIQEYQEHKVIVVEECHNFRNPNTNRWENLFNLLSNDSEKKLILLTATPVNNTLFDLYHQLRFITRDQEEFFAAAGIPNLRAYFIHAENNRDTLYEILEAIAVRRSRQFIKKNYPDAEIDGQPIKFPERELHSARYSLEKSYGSGLYQRVADAIENLNLAPYQVDMFRKEVVEPRKALLSQLSLFDDEKRQESLMEKLQRLGWDEKKIRNFLWDLGRQNAIVHIMRVLYLKRLESSVHALKTSLRRQRDFQEKFLQALEAGRLLNSAAYRKWLQMESVDELAELSRDVSEILQILPKLNLDEYDVELLKEKVKEDIEVLDGLLAELEELTPEQDDKLQTLKKLLAGDLKGKKVVVFSYFKDTARYIYRQLREDKDFQEQANLTVEKMSIVDSGVSPEERLDRIRRFAPESNRANVSAEGEIQVLFSTDVLSEGQNLQDADTIINYDLHWNPIRMVQRIGRLDRIGSPYNVIHVYNFIPEDALERLLRLMERLWEKLERINRSVGLDASVLGETPNPMDFNTLRRIAQEDRGVLDELEADSELTIGEFLMQDLMQFLKRVGEERLSQIPYGVGTVREGKEGIKGFFAAFRNRKTLQHYWLFEPEGDAGRKVIKAKLEAIKPIRSTEDEQPAKLPQDFDPRPRIERLRKELVRTLRQVAHRLAELPSPQNSLVNLLNALPPSAERNALLAYFERPLTGIALRELRSLWRERGKMSQQQFLQKLREFMEKHPHPEMEKQPSLEEVNEKDFEGVAWMLVV